MDTLSSIVMVLVTGLVIYMLFSIARSSPPGEKPVPLAAQVINGSIALTKGLFGLVVVILAIFVVLGIAGILIFGLKQLWAVF